VLHGHTTGQALRPLASHTRHRRRLRRNTMILHKRQHLIVKKLRHFRRAHRRQNRQEPKPAAGAAVHVLRHAIVEAHAACHAGVERHKALVVRLHSAPPAVFTHLRRRMRYKVPVQVLHFLCERRTARVLAELLGTAAHADHLPIKKEQAAAAAVARNHHVSRMEVAVH
jgi:hypothetical protein